MQRLWKIPAGARGLATEAYSGTRSVTRNARPVTSVVMRDKWRARLLFLSLLAGFVVLLSFIAYDMPGASPAARRARLAPAHPANAPTEAAPATLGYGAVSAEEAPKTPYR